MTGLILRHSSVADGNLALHNVSGDADIEDAVSNRAHLLRGMGVTLDDLVVAEQVHGAVVRTVQLGDRGRGSRRADDAVPGTDGLITREPGIALMMLGADCPLVCLFDPVRPGLALLHAGWRGIVADVLEAGIEMLDPPDPARLHAFLGACAGPCCYEIGPDVAARFPHATLDEAGTIKLDLPKEVASRLGVSVERIGPECTICAPGAFSYRADGTPDRHALAAMLTDARIP